MSGTFPQVRKSLSRAILRGSFPALHNLNVPTFALTNNSPNELSSEINLLTSFITSLLGVTLWARVLASRPASLGISGTCDYTVLGRPAGRAREDQPCLCRAIYFFASMWPIIDYDFNGSCKTLILCICPWAFPCRSTTMWITLFYYLTSFKTKRAFKTLVVGLEGGAPEGSG